MSVETDMRRPNAALVLTAGLAMATVAPPSQAQAQGRDWGWGVVAGFVAGAASKFNPGLFRLLRLRLSGLWLRLSQIWFGLWLWTGLRGQLRLSGLQRWLRPAVQRLCLRGSPGGAAGRRPSCALALRRRICHGIVNQRHRVVLQAFRHVTVKVDRDGDAAVAKPLQGGKRQQKARATRPGHRRRRDPMTVAVRRPLESNRVTPFIVVVVNVVRPRESRYRTLPVP